PRSTALRGRLRGGQREDYSLPSNWWSTVAPAGSAWPLSAPAAASAGSAPVFGCDEVGVGVGVGVDAACTASAPPPTARIAGTARIASLRFQFIAVTRLSREFAASDR